MKPSNRISLITALAATAVLALPSPSVARPKPPSKPAAVPNEVAETDRQMNDLILACRVAQYGRQHKSAEALLAAANMVAGISTIDLHYKGGKEADVKLNPRTWIGEALRVSGNNPHIVALAKKISDRLTAAGRSPVVIPIRLGRGKMEGHQYRYHDITFNANEPAHAHITYDGSDVKLQVYELSTGRLVGAAEDDIGYADIFWQPAKRAVYRIVVRNPSSRPAQYILICR